MHIEVVPTTSFSGDFFSVSFYDPSITNETPYLTNVVFIFNEETYQIPVDDESGEILIQAPLVLVNSTFIIEAYKDGYDPANRTIDILAKESEPSFVLDITVLNDEKVVKAFQEFRVLVTDLYGNPIQGATVYIQELNPKEQSIITDINGTVTLTAPNYDEITLITNKTGYEQGQLIIWLKTQPTITDELLNHPYTPIALAVLILITVIIYVARKNKLDNVTKFDNYLQDDQDRINQDNTSRTSKKMISPSNKKNNDKTLLHEQKDSKIEEIHLPVDNRSKETITIGEQTNKKEPSTFETHRWFEKTSEVEKKVDTLKEPKVEENTEKWFVGTDTLRRRIDETLQEKDKKQPKKRYGSP